ncbi:MAG: SDR family oxidoreductase [Betaproteobacteria bacterium]|nr:SDR family oxidoreductase [Betaproteobacteria bacterium]
MSAPSPDSHPLKGKVALVTGGTGGIGASICIALAQAGATVNVGFSRSGDAAQALVTSLHCTGPDHRARHADVTDSSQLYGVAKAIGIEHGRLDLLVNCAGITRFVPHPDLDDLDDPLIDTILTTNVRGAFAATRACRGLLAAHGDGCVVNISSIAARTAMGSNIAYCASKAALDNMTMSLARALAPKIRVISVSPGLSDTDFVRQMDAAWRDEQALRTPLRRLAAPDEIAQAVIAAATVLRFTTGAIIPVDGGRPLA